MDPPGAEWVRCPNCGADNRPGPGCCFLCLHAISPEAERVLPSPERPQPPVTFAAGRTFSLASLLLMIALMAICLGVGHEVPGLGIALAIVSAPALIRTTVLASRSRGRGRPMSASAKVWMFLASLAAVVVVFLSAVVAFFATCFPIGWVSVGLDSQPGMLVAFIAGAVTAIAAPIFTYRLICRLRDRGPLT